MRKSTDSKAGSLGLKDVFFVALLAVAGVLSLPAAFLKDVPVELRQPNGIIVKALVTGDEFYRTVHDAERYTSATASISFSRTR